MSSALRPGQKVKLTGTVESIPGPCNEGCAYVLVDGDYDGSSVRSFPYAALTPVVEAEPQWVPGDVVRIDGKRNYMLCRRIDGVLQWITSDDGYVALPIEELSSRWHEGRVEIVYRKEADK